MNREIKFRAWDKKASKMRFVENISFYRFDLPKKYANDRLKFCGATLTVEKGEMRYYKKCEIELMEYTDLHDKNGKEIYESDILKYGDDVFEVFFANGCFCVQDIKISHKNYALYSLIYMKIEIIGNIYQNSNLLETRKV